MLLVHFSPGGSVRIVEYHICLIFKYSQWGWPLGHALKITILFKNTVTRIYCQDIHRYILQHGPGDKKVSFNKCFDAAVL